MENKAIQSQGKQGLILEEPFLFEQSLPDSIGVVLPESEVDEIDIESALPSALIRKDIPQFPMLSEQQVVRHFTRLSTWNYSVDGGFYPLGSCTMKYNPKLNEVVANMSGFADIHPYLPDEKVQGILSILWDLEQYLQEISGLDAVSLQPAAGSHGELLGILLMRNYHKQNGDSHRNTILVTASAHGTNPSSAAMGGYKVKSLPILSNGLTNLQALQESMTEEIAGLMITNPSTCGLFEADIVAICKIVHEKGGLVYFDGANMNALLGKARPGDMGADILHFNTHKTFATPHGGGGPGAGPIAVVAKLKPYLPTPHIVKTNESFKLEYNVDQSIGKVRSFYGNIGVLLRAYTYIRTLGASGLEEVAENAVLNARYLAHKLQDTFHMPFTTPCMHEVLLTDEKQTEQGITTMDIAKALLDEGFHPPTVYFPLVVKAAMLIEPTETESKQTIDLFIAALHKIIKQDHNVLASLPTKTKVKRVDEVSASRTPCYTWYC